MLAAIKHVEEDKLVFQQQWTGNLARNSVKLLHNETLKFPYSIQPTAETHRPCTRSRDCSANKVKMKAVTGWSLIIVIVIVTVIFIIRRLVGKHRRVVALQCPWQTAHLKRSALERLESSVSWWATCSMDDHGHVATSGQEVDWVTCWHGVKEPYLQRAEAHAQRQMCVGRMQVRQWRMANHSQDFVVPASVQPADSEKLSPAFLMKILQRAYICRYSRIHVFAAYNKHDKCLVYSELGIKLLSFHVRVRDIIAVKARPIWCVKSGQHGHLMTVNNCLGKERCQLLQR